MQTTKEKSVFKEVTINAPLSLAWSAWTFSDRVSEWFAPEALVEPFLGGAYELYFIPGNTIDMNTKGCKITNLIEQKKLHFTWKGPNQFNDIMNNENSLTVVKIDFSEIDRNTTKISVEHTGFMDDEEWSEANDWHEEAWTGVLSSLKSALEKGEGNLCCQPID